MAEINMALAGCSAEPPGFYEDEVDIHLNPKIVAGWQLRGQQKRVVTPGRNEKYYLAGVLHNGTGKVNHTDRLISIIYQFVKRYEDDVSAGGSDYVHCR